MNGNGNGNSMTSNFTQNVTIFAHIFRTDFIYFPVSHHISIWTIYLFMAVHTLHTTHTPVQQIAQVNITLVDFRDLCFFFLFLYFVPFSPSRYMLMFVWLSSFWQLFIHMLCMNMFFFLHWSGYKAIYQKISFWLKNSLIYLVRFFDFSAINKNKAFSSDHFNHFLCIFHTTTHVLTDTDTDTVWNDISFQFMPDAKKKKTENNFQFNILCICLTALEKQTHFFDLCKEFSYSVWII